MRFLLDSDVDVAVALVLRRAGEETWIAAQAGLVGPVAATDEEIAAYAIAHDAVIVSHESARPTPPQRVSLDVAQPDAADALRHHLDDVLAALRSGANQVTVSWQGVVASPRISGAER